MDCLVDLNNGESLIMEIQTTKVTEEKLESIIDYILYVKKNHNKNVRFGLIHASNKKNIVEYEFKISEELILKPLVYTFTEEDGDEILNSLKNKIENNEKLTEEDINDLSLISLYPTKQTAEILQIETAKLIPKIKNLSKKEIDSIIQMHLILVTKVKSKEIRENIIRCLSMKKKSALQEAKEMWIEEGIEKGREKGIEEQNKTFIKKLKDKGLSTKEISNLTDYPIETINILLKL